MKINLAQPIGGLFRRDWDWLHPTSVINPWGLISWPVLTWRGGRLVIMPPDECDIVKCICLFSTLPGPLLHHLRKIEKERLKGGKPAHSSGIPKIAQDRRVFFGAKSKRKSMIS